MKVTKIRQRFADDGLSDVEATVGRELREAAARGALRLQGKRVAVAVGSRGIADVASIVRTVVSWLREAGASPFVVPAMGSHGGATAAGQTRVLAEYGVTPEGVGAPVVSTMDVVEMEADGLGHRLYLDAHAARADGIVVVNRIKPHTDFHGEVESGLMKMCVIGLGKQRGASEMHALGALGMAAGIPRAAERMLADRRFLLGLAVVENARDRPRTVRALLPGEIPAGERLLLREARACMARLPVEDLDVLVVDELGKDVSGTGLDTNVIGRMRIDGVPEPASPRVRRIVALTLTPASHGNALGMGLADFVTREFRDAVDFDATYENVLTATFLARAMLPLVAPTEVEAVGWAIRSLGAAAEPGKVRLARIRSTLRLEELWVSAPVLEELRGRADIEVTTETRPDVV